MNGVSRQNHWENVYATKGEDEVSWFQEAPEPSLQLIELAGASRSSGIIDIGGGASRLVDYLVSQGYEDLTVLDLSAAALASARSRIGDKADRVTWIAADVTAWEPSRTYDVWHDRAAFHFLTDPKDQMAYVARLRRALRPGGHGSWSRTVRNGSGSSAVRRRQPRARTVSCSYQRQEHPLGER